jgi:hypothetical protein
MCQAVGDSGLLSSEVTSRVAREYSWIFLDMLIVESRQRSVRDHQLMSCSRKDEFSATATVVFP